MRGGRNGSRVKFSYCSRSGAKFSSQHPHLVSELPVNSSYRRSNALVCHSLAPKHTHSCADTRNHLKQATRMRIHVGKNRFSWNGSYGGRATGGLRRPETSPRPLPLAAPSPQGFPPLALRWPQHLLDSRPDWAGAVGPRRVPFLAVAGFSAQKSPPGAYHLCPSVCTVHVNSALVAPNFPIAGPRILTPATLTRPLDGLHLDREEVTVAETLCQLASLHFERLCICSSCTCMHPPFLLPSLHPQIPGVGAQDLEN